MRAGISNGHLPVGAGHVPVQFVVIVEIAQSVLHAVMQDKRARSVAGIWHIDLEFEVPALALLVNPQRLVRRVASVARTSERKSE